MRTATRFWRDPSFSRYWRFSRWLFPREPSLGQERPDRIFDAVALTPPVLEHYATGRLVKRKVLDGHRAQNPAECN